MEATKELSECSSGCESGWTMYLEQSEGNPWNPACEVGGDDSGGGGEEEDGDDLSMISDASSGPPHFHHEDDPLYCHQCGENNGLLCCCFTFASSLFAAAATSGREDGKRRRVEGMVNLHQQKPHGQRKQACADSLDDTASSPLFGFSQNADLNYGINIRALEDVVELSNGFSATHFKGTASEEKHLSYQMPGSAFPDSPRGGRSKRL